MDDPAVSPAELGSALEYIRRVNQRLGGISTLLSPLRDWSAGWVRGETITLLDIGTGSADLPVAAWRWAQDAGFKLRATGIDKHPKTLDYAREFVKRAGGLKAVEIIEADALALDQRFAPGSFDYVHAGLFLHHLTTADAITVLASMRRLARRGVIWNDLVRSPLGVAFIRLATIAQPRMIRHDATVSVQAGFRKREALEMARQAGWESPEHHWNLFTHRFCVTQAITPPLSASPAPNEPRAQARASSRLSQRPNSTPTPPR
jgi:ubiquinone/menaquinone biosynthesis C-methylase UbiE